MKRFLKFFMIGVCGVATAQLQPAQAAGLLLADGGLGGQMELVDHEVKVTINNGIAVTHVTQVFRNKENRQVEALYSFPVPRGASVANFSMWINGAEMVGEVVEKERAREIYNSYKVQKRDPGLLEQVDYRTFEMRIFPVAPNGDQKVQITYYQELEMDDDTFTYVYPLATSTRANADTRVSERLAFNLDVRSAIPLVEVDSPSHGTDFVIAKHESSYYQASLETPGGNVDEDIVVRGRCERAKTGLDVTTSHPRGEDGYFFLTLTAGDDLGKLDTGMDYIFVIDISGSMANDGKLLTSKKSVAAFLNGLQPDDAFDVLTFNVQPTTHFGELRTATQTDIDSAANFLNSQAAAGGTVLKPAMTTAYRYIRPDRPLNVVILSDGLTEQRERQELMQLIQSRPAGSRVFCIGVGNDVNRPLLEQMAEESGGLSAFISQGDDFERQAKSFHRKLTRPAASQLKITVNGVDAYDIEPTVLPDLYHGAPVRMYGRYKGSGKAQIAVSADVRGVAFKQNAEIEFPAQDDSNPEIERMWALKRVDGLLKAADRNGNRPRNVTDEIIVLGETYSIVTEYTSFLVLENDAEYRRWKIDRRNVDRTGRDRTAQERRTRDLDLLRNKAANELGPQPVEQKQAEAPVQTSASTPNAGSNPSTPTQVANNRPRQSWDFNVGTGPVGPLFVVVAAWLSRRRRQAA